MKAFEIANFIRGARPSPTPLQPIHPFPEDYRLNLPPQRRRQWIDDGGTMKKTKRA